MILPVVFAALADPTRLELVRLLADGPKTATQLFVGLGISQPRASRHLRILREAGLIIATRQGRWVRFEIAAGREVGLLISLVSGKGSPEVTAPGPRDSVRQETRVSPPVSERPRTPEPPRTRPDPSEIEEFLL